MPIFNLLVTGEVDAQVMPCMWSRPPDKPMWATPVWKTFLGGAVRKILEPLMVSVIHSCGAAALPKDTLTSATKMTIF